MILAGVGGVLAVVFVFRGDFEKAVADFDQALQVLRLALSTGLARSSAPEHRCSWRRSC